MPPTDSRGFDRLAPGYRWIERAALGASLMEARLALLDELPPIKHALVLGDGDGRLLERLLRRQPDCLATSIDFSQAMLTLQSRRLRRAGLDRRVELRRCDLLDCRLPQQRFDLIVTAFVLDCFTEQTLQQLIPRLAASLTPEASWYFADFRQPASGWRALRAQAWLRVTYAFFRWQTSIESVSLVDPEPLLFGQGFRKVAERQRRFGMLVTRLYERTSAGTMSAAESIPAG